MKSWIVNTLLGLSVCVAVFFFNIKFKSPTDPEKIRKGLAGVQKYLPTGSHLVFKCDVQGGDMYPTYVAYYLTPVKLVLPTPGGNDTTLLLVPINSTDSASTAMVNTSSILWQNADDRYRYILLRHS